MTHDHLRAAESGRPGARQLPHVPLLGIHLNLISLQLSSDKLIDFPAISIQAMFMRRGVNMQAAKA